MLCLQVVSRLHNIALSLDNVNNKKRHQNNKNNNNKIYIYIITGRKQKVLIQLTVSVIATSVEHIAMTDAVNYWDTYGSPVIKHLCFFVVFFFLHHKMEKLHNSAQWSLGPQHHDN